MEEHIKDFGKKLKRTRLIRGYSQAELAEKLGISRSYVHLIEKGAAEPKKTTKSVIVEWMERGRNKYDYDKRIDTTTITQTIHGNGRQAGRDMITSGHHHRPTQAGAGAIPGNRADPDKPANQAAICGNTRIAEQSSPRRRHHPARKPSPAAPYVHIFELVADKAGNALFTGGQGCQ
jgi:DNA-binding XRE family transcriptional regulator